MTQKRTGAERKGGRRKKNGQQKAAAYHSCGGPIPFRGALFLLMAEILFCPGSDQLFNLLFHDLLHVGSGLEAGDNIALSVYQELGEVPLDLGVVLIILIDP